MSWGSTGVPFDEAELGLALKGAMDHSVQKVMAVSGDHGKTDQALAEGGDEARRDIEEANLGSIWSLKYFEFFFKLIKAVVLNKV